jgi:hypothetical protein
LFFWHFPTVFVSCVPSNIASIMFKTSLNIRVMDWN